PYPSLFIATPPYEVWRRSHGRAVAARDTCCTNGGLQAITYLIISTEWVRTSRWLLWEGKHGDRLKEKVGAGFGSRIEWAGVGQRQGDGAALRPRGAKFKVPRG